VNIRALPIGLSPVPRETLGSYLHRIADANHITITAISQLLGTNRRYRRSDDDSTTWTTQTVSTLAALTGRSANTLTRALPALRPLEAVDATTAMPGTPAGSSPCAACQHCMASKGIHGLVIQRGASQERICLRHQRWLHGPEQHPLHVLPELCTANRQHRQLVHRHDAATLGTTLARAQQLIDDWIQAGDQPDLQRRWADRLSLLRRDPYADPYRPSRYRIELATYPETVALTKLHLRNLEHPDFKSATFNENPALAVSLHMSSRRSRAPTDDMILETSSHDATR
jgi:hypothetical protein